MSTETGWRWRALRDLFSKAMRAASPCAVAATVPGILQCQSAPQVGQG